MKSALLSLLLIPTTALAINIRVIGNAGGDEAMMALTRFSIMKDYLRFCLRPGNLCGLEENERHSLRDLLDRREPRDANSLIPKSLVDEGLDKDRAMLLGWLADAASVQFVRLAEYPPAWVSLSEKLYLDADWKSQELYLADTSQVVRSYEFQGIRQSAYLVIEDESNENSRELTQILSSKIECETAGSRLTGFDDFRAERQGFSGQVRWRCGETDFRARFMAKGQEATWSFLVFGTETYINRPAGSASCVSGLTNPRK